MYFSLIHVASPRKTKMSQKMRGRSELENLRTFTSEFATRTLAPHSGLAKLKSFCRRGVASAAALAGAGGAASAGSFASFAASAAAVRSSTEQYEYAERSSNPRRERR